MKKTACLRRGLVSRRRVPAGPASAEANAPLPNVPHGVLLAVIQFAQKHEGQARADGAAGHLHDAVQLLPETGRTSQARRRSGFPLLLVQAAGDTEGASTPAFNALLRR
jgi:hypothetical protein